MHAQQLIAMVCDSDACCKHFAPIYQQRLLQAGQRQRTRATTLTLSAMLTILVYVHWSHYRTFTHSYTECVVAHLRPYFPCLGSSTRVVELLPRARIPLCGYRHTRTGRCTGIACIDSTPLAVCDKHRIGPNIAKLPQGAPSFHPSVLSICFCSCLYETCMV